MAGTLISSGIALFLLAAITALPLRIMLELNVSHRPTLNVRVGVAGLHVDYEGNVVHGGRGWVIDISRKRGKPRQFDIRKLADQAKQFASLAKGSLKAQDRLLKSIRVKTLALDCRIGTGDAASTALVCGLVESIVWATCAHWQLVPHMTVAPEYSRPALILTLNGMFSVPVGNIISAAGTVGLEYGKGRIKAWIKRRKVKAIPAVTQ